MIQQLQKYFSIRNVVSAAYLAQMQTMEEEYPSLVVGVMVNEKLSETIEQTLNKELTVLIQDTL